MHLITAISYFCFVFVVIVLPGFATPNRLQFAKDVFGRYVFLVEKIGLDFYKKESGAAILFLYHCSFR